MYKINLLCFNCRQRNRDKIGSPQCCNTFQLHFTRVVTCVSKTCDERIVLKTSDFTYYTTCKFRCGRKSSNLIRSIDRLFKTVFARFVRKTKQIDTKQKKQIKNKIGFFFFLVYFFNNTLLLLLLLIHAIPV